MPSNSATIIESVFIMVSIFAVVVIVAAQIYNWNFWPKSLRTYSFAFIFVTYFSKLFFVLFLFVDDFFRAAKWVAGLFGITGAFEPGTALMNSSGITRSDFLVRAGVILASIPFTALIIGMMRGKYEYQVREVVIKIKKLPEAFTGFRVLQISDLHTGSFIDTAPLQKAVEMINSLNADVIFFTGDLVNNKHDELTPHKPALSRIRARHGVYSILGNHDYGDYYPWPSQQEKTENLNRLIQSHGELGWNILLDEYRFIEKEGQKLGIIGVQNWSARMNFARYGNLEKAVRNVPDDSTNILLTHDPSHWRAEVAEKKPFIKLTLSGHTHGFQFGVDIPGFRWSPVQYMYREWADLYSENGQHLYVNRGMGFLGYPGRVGILPEITVIELQPDESVQATA